MTSFPNLYIPSSNWIDDCTLHDGHACHDHLTLVGQSTLSERRTSTLSSSSGASLSAASSAIHGSRPSTPQQNVLQCDGQFFTYFRRVPMTPTNTKNSCTLQTSPYTHSNIRTTLGPGTQSSAAQRHTIRCFTQNGPECFKSSTTTPVRSQASFASDISSFSSPTSAEGYSEYDLHRGLWNIVGLHGGAPFEEIAEQEAPSLSDSFESTVWDGEYIHGDSSYTVNPCDTVSSYHDPLTICENHTSKGDLVFLVGTSPGEDSSCASAGMLPDEDCAESSACGTSELSSDLLDESAVPEENSPAAIQPNATSKRKPGAGPRSRARSNLVRKRQHYVRSADVCAEVDITPTQKYICRFAPCNGRFSRSEHLTRHYKIHTGERHYICALAHSGGDGWHKPQKKGTRKNWSRSDNQMDHLITHLKAGGRNKCVDRMFLYWCMRKYEPKRERDPVAQLEKKWRHKKIILGPPDLDLQHSHPDWPEFVAWRDNGGTIESLISGDEDPTMEDE